MSRSKKPTLTSSAGIPVGDSQNSLTASPRGPLLIHDGQLFEKHSHFNRERIPELVVYAKGSGAQSDRSTPRRRPSEVFRTNAEYERSNNDE